jgi:hypothetical protein
MKNILKCMVILAAFLNAQPNLTDGQAWATRWTEEYKILYMLGFKDGSQAERASVEVSLQALASPNVSSAVMRRLQIMASFAHCEGKMTVGQLIAIADKAIKDHPETWDQDIGVLAYKAFLDACDARKGSK